MNEQITLSDLAKVFLKLGSTAFGGPAAHIAMMEEEVVRQRQWINDDEFLDLIGMINLIPGPNSTELAIHIGHKTRGWLGLLIAGSCFIFPAFFIVLALAWLYVTYAYLPAFDRVLYGIKPVIIAIVIQALWSLGKSALKTKILTILAVIVVALNFLGINELILLIGSGVIAGLLYGTVQKVREKHTLRCLFLWPVMTILNPSSSVAVVASTSAFGLWPLFLFFLKVGSVLFGSGYVLLAFLQSEIVEKYGWLTEAQLLDAIAIGQVTPGPVFTTATFIGYVLGGWSGAVVATLGIFLPAFFFVAISGPLIPRLRKAAFTGAILDGFNAAAVALMIVVTLQLAGTAFVDWITLLLGAVSTFLLIRLKLNSVWLIAGSVVIGLATSLIS